LEFLNSEPIMRAKKLLTSRHIFRYAVPARTVTKKALDKSMIDEIVDAECTNVHVPLFPVCVVCSMFIALILYKETYNCNH